MKKPLYNISIVNDHHFSESATSIQTFCTWYEIQGGNQSVDSRYNRLYIELIVHMGAYTFANPTPLHWCAGTLSFAKWYLTLRPVLSTPREIVSNARARYPEVPRYRNAEVRDYSATSVIRCPVSVR